MKASLLLYLWHIASKIWQDSKSNKMGASYSWEAGTFGSKKFESPKSYCVKSYLALYTHTAVNHLSVRRHHPPTICDWMTTPEADLDWTTYRILSLLDYMFVCRDTTIKPLLFTKRNLFLFKLNSSIHSVGIIDLIIHTLCPL